LELQGFFALLQDDTELSQPTEQFLQTLLFGQ